MPRRSSHYPVVVGLPLTPDDVSRIDAIARSVADDMDAAPPTRTSVARTALRVGLASLMQQTTAQVRKRARQRKGSVP